MDVTRMMTRLALAALALAVTARSLRAAEVEPEAAPILREMSDHLGSVMF